MGKSITAVRWCRVSSDEQKREGYSLEEQNRMTTEYCRREGLQIVGEWLDVSESAWGKEPRPLFDAMMAYVQRQGVDRLVVAKFDRIARNTPDFDRAWTAPRGARHGQGLVSVTEPVPPGAAGCFTAKMLACVAEFSSNQSSERIKVAMEAKARAGTPPGPVPFGYRHERRDGRDLVVQEPEEIAVMRELFGDAATGRFTLDALTAKLAVKVQALGRRPLKRSALHNLFSNEFYLGLFQWAGQSWPGNYAPALSPHEFEDARRGMGRAKGSYHYRRHHHAYRGLIVCGQCAKAMTSELQKGRVYYRCHRCQGATLREDRAAGAFAQMVKVIEVGKAEAAYILKRLRQLVTDDTEGQRRRQTALQRRITEIQSRIDKALDLRLDGKLDDDTFERRQREWAKELAATKAELAQIDLGPTQGLTTLEKIFELSERAYDLVVRQTPAEMRRLLEIVLSNSVWDGVTLAPKYRSPFDILAERASVHDGRGDWI